MDESDATIAYLKIKRIQRLERRIQHLWYAPFIAFLMIVSYIFYVSFVAGRTAPQFFDLLMIGSQLIAMGAALVKRNDDIMELMSLKYAERKET